jgi:hypothetical protein
MSTEAWGKESVGDASVLFQEVKGLQEARMSTMAVSMLKCLKDAEEWVVRKLGEINRQIVINFRLVSRCWFLFEAKYKQILVLSIRIVSYGNILIDLVCYLLQYFGLMNCDNPNNEHIYFCNTSW